MQNSFSEIVFQNEFLIAVDKKSGVLTVPSRMGKDDPRPCLGIELQKFLKSKLFPVHRLDFEVSGLVIFAHSSEAQSILSVEFEKQRVHKTYDAFAAVSPEHAFAENQPFTWTCHLAKGKKRAFEAPHGKKSITIATLLRAYPQYGHWHLCPKTGRSHQLRFEMFRHGCAILGDALYGSKERYLPGAIALRAMRIEFENKSLANDLKIPLIFETKPLPTFGSLPK